MKLRFALLTLVALTAALLLACSTGPETPTVQLVTETPVPPGTKTPCAPPTGWTRWDTTEPLVFHVGKSTYTFKLKDNVLEVYLDPASGGQRVLMIHKELASIADVVPMASNLGNDEYAVQLVAISRYCGAIYYWKKG